MPLSHLTLVVPDLLWADPDLRREATRELPLPALGWLLGRGQARAQAQSASACLAELFAAPADLPVARALACADGLAADDGHWLCADPVHLRVEQDYLLLADARMFALNQAEADALVATLNSHFGQDGLCFYAPTPIAGICAWTPPARPSSPRWPRRRRKILIFICRAASAPAIGGICSTSCKCCCSITR